MDNVIEKTKELIEELDNSSLIKDLDYYKEKVIQNNSILELINKYNNTNDDYEKISLKKQLYNYEDYTNYMKYYNELSFYIMRINSIYKKIANTKGGCLGCE